MTSRKSIIAAVLLIALGYNLAEAVRGGTTDAVLAGLIAVSLVILIRAGLEERRA